MTQCLLGGNNIEEWRLNTRRQKATPQRREHAEETGKSGHRGGLISGAHRMRIVRIVQRQEKSITNADADRFDRRLASDPRNDVAFGVLGAIDGALIERIQGCDVGARLRRGQRKADVDSGAPALA